MLDHSVHAFAEAEGQPLLTDVFTCGSDTPLPAVLILHGGAWQSGSRSQYHHWGKWLAENGYVAVAVDYRLSSSEKATWPAVLADVRAALDFVRTEAPELGIDATRLALMGSSAGAHLAAMATLTSDSSPKDSSHRVRDAPNGARADVRAVVSVYGVFDLREWWTHVATARQDRPLENLFGGERSEHEETCRVASPIVRVTGEGPGRNIAWLVAWGTEDAIVPEAGQSVAFAEALRSAGASVQTLAIPGAGHFWLTADDIDEGANATLKQDLLPFLNRYVAQLGDGDK